MAVALFRKYWLFSLLVIIGCSPKEDDKPVVTEVGYDDVYILHEGNFGWGSSSISIYDPDSRTVQNRVYENQNDEVIGNVLNFGAKLEENLYAWVVNNSGKIEITDRQLNKINTISGLVSPRQVYVHSNRLVVTDLYAKKISFLNKKTFGLVNEVKMNGWTESIAQDRNLNLWVTNVNSAYIYQINEEIQVPVDSVRVGFGAHSIRADWNGNLWIRLFGDAVNQNDSAGLVVFNPIENELVKRIVWLKESQLPVQLGYSFNKSAVVTLKQGKVIEINIDDFKVKELIDLSDRNPYAIGVNFYNGDIYISDAKNYTSNSDILRYDDEGILIDQFETDIIATHFVFGSY